MIKLRFFIHIHQVIDLIHRSILHDIQKRIFDSGLLLHPVLDLFFQLLLIRPIIRILYSDIIRYCIKFLHETISIRSEPRSEPCSQRQEKYEQSRHDSCTDILFFAGKHLAEREMKRKPPLIDPRCHSALKMYILYSSADRANWRNFAYFCCFCKNNNEKQQ